MRIAAVEAYGIEDAVVDVWRETGHESLLPVQELALTKHNALDGRNLLVFSPTSSGKTFVGEMAAVKKARGNSRVLYLVPQKALAEEKYGDLRRKYSRLGIRTVISTRDRREFDRDINAGRFHIAVVVYEKMQGLLVSNPALPRHIGLVVADELQMIGDKERGPNLEILLTKLKLADSRPQIIGHSAVLGNSRILADWLGAELCATRFRPVELRRGVLWNGTFRYIEHNGRRDGREKLVRAEDGASAQEMLVRQVKAFVEAGEQCLVFCKAKRDCVSTAIAIAKLLEGSPADGALKELGDLEDSRNKDILTRLLSHRVAYHNADVDADQRELVERHFREGGIMALCATTTLALGMNLPARNVFVDPERWDHDRTGHWTQVPISQAEYENMSGRAGRLGLEKEFGRGIVIAETEFMARTYWSCYVLGTLGKIEPTLDRDPLDQHVLNLVASGICATGAELRNVLLSSLTGETCWRGGERERKFERKLRSAAGLCLEEGLIERRDRGRLAATDLGRAAAVKGIAVDTAIHLARFARGHRDGASGVHLLEILLCLAGTADGERVYFNLSTEEQRSNRYPAMLDERVRDLPGDVRERLSEAVGRARVNYDDAKRLKKALILHDWLTDVPTREIENRFFCYAGSIAHMALEFSWLAESLAAIAEVCGWPRDQVGRLRSLSEQLVSGAPTGGVEIARAQVRGLGRARMGALVAAGLDTLEKAAAAPRKQVEKLLTKRVTGEFLKRVAALLERGELDREHDEVERGVSQEAEADLAKAAPEWTPEFPPADDSGASYLSTARVHIDGRRNDRRFLVLVNGKKAWLREKPFECALRLAVGAKTTDLGWVRGTDLGGHDCYHQHIRRLKHDLKPSAANVEKLVENSRDKQYRFSVPPANVTIDVDTISQHSSGLARDLEALRPNAGQDDDAAEEARPERT